MYVAHNKEDTVGVAYLELPCYGSKDKPDVFFKNIIGFHNRRNNLCC